jgi:hypothetical protein
MSLTNMRTDDELEAQFQPEELEVTHGAIFSELAILGLGHKPLQYTGSENLEFDVQLRFYKPASHDIVRTHRFIHSLTRPQRGDTVAGGGAPEVLFYWPTLYTVVSKVRGFKEKTTQFARSGAPLLMIYELKIHSISDVQVLSEDVRRTGFRGLT